MAHLGWFIVQTLAEKSKHTQTFHLNVNEECALCIAHELILFLVFTLIKANSQQINAFSGNFWL